MASGGAPEPIDFSSDLDLIFLLPQVDDDAEDKGRSGWINFKRVIWHDSFYKLLETIERHSAEGCWVRCGDDVVRHIYPLIFILAADYEEQ